MNSHNKLWMWLKVESDRTAALWCAAVPILLVIFAFAAVLSLSMFGVPVKGTVRFAVAGASFVYVTFASVWATGYSIGLLWLWWSTRNENAPLLRRLWQMPLVAACFAWAPGLVIAPIPAISKVKLYPPMAFAVGTFALACVAAARGMLYLWRRK